MRSGRAPTGMFGPSRRNRFPVGGADPLAPLPDPQVAGTGPIAAPPMNGDLAQQLLARADMSEKGHKGLFPGKDWKTLVPMIANALLAFNARTNPASMAMLQNNMAMARDRRLAAQKLEAERLEAEREARQPHQVGDSFVKLNPATGQYETLFRDPQPFEAYAQSLGLVPGSPEYVNAVENYRLGPWSDAAVQAKTGLTGYRYDRMGGLQEDRQDHSVGMQEDRQVHSDSQLDQRLSVTRRGQDLSHGDRVRGQDISRNNNIRSTDTSRDNNIRSNDTRLRTNRRTPRPAGPATSSRYGEGAIIEDAKGNKLRLQGGRWVPVR